MAKSKGTRSPPSVVAANGPVPVPPPVVAIAKKSTTKRHEYTSDGVADHDVFWLPRFDYEIMFFSTVLATIVRLFRIYQPNSVVFDEVQ